MSKKQVHIVVITLSDRCSQGMMQDLSGPVLVASIKEMGFVLNKSMIIPDDHDLLKQQLIYYSEQEPVDIIITNGGTGIGPRDITPDVTRLLIDYEIPGFGEWLRMESRQYTSNWFLSRAIAGIKHQTLIINFPGSPKACQELFSKFRFHLYHMLEMIHGCGHDMEGVLHHDGH